MQCIYLPPICVSTVVVPMQGSSAHLLYCCAACYDIKIVITHITGTDNGIVGFYLVFSYIASGYWHLELTHHQISSKSFLSTSLGQFIYLGVAHLGGKYTSPKSILDSTLPLSCLQPHLTVLLYPRHPTQILQVH